MKEPAPKPVSQPAPAAADAPRAISVSVVEDDPEARALLQNWLGTTNGFRCASAHPDLPSALAGLPEARPDIVLMDLHLPGGSGIECIRRLKPRMTQTQFLVITVYDDSNSIYQALSAGATGYLLKRVSKKELFASLHLVQAGGSPMSNAIARRVAQAFALPALDQPGKDLSEREAAVLALLAQGHPEKEIAEKLGISRHTVHTYIRRIYEKLHVHSHAQAIARFSTQRQG